MLRAFGLGGLRCSGFRVWGVQGLASGVQGLGMRLQTTNGLGCSPGKPQTCGIPY